MPNLLMYFFALFDHRINFRWVRQHLGRELKFSNNKSVIELGLHYRSPHQTLIDCSQSLISHGIIKYVFFYLLINNNFINLND